MFVVCFCERKEVEIFSWGADWKSRVVPSSKDAEFNAAYLCIQQIKKLQGLLKELGFPQTKTILFMDNLPCIKTFIGDNDGDLDFTSDALELHMIKEEQKAEKKESSWRAKKSKKKTKSKKKRKKKKRENTRIFQRHKFFFFCTFLSEKMHHWKRRLRTQRRDERRLREERV